MTGIRRFYSTLRLVMLLAGCASDRGVAKGNYEIGPGSPITIQVTRAQGRFGDSAGLIEFGVEITNVSDHDVIVDTVRVSPEGGSTAYRMDPVTKKINELISDGEDYTAELRSWGSQVRALRSDEPAVILLRVRVTLTNGDTYHGSYEMPVEVFGRF